MHSLHSLGASPRYYIAHLGYAYSLNYLIRTCDALCTLQTQCDNLDTVWHIYHTYHVNSIMISIETMFNPHPLPLSGIIPMCDNPETMCRCTQYCMHVHALCQCRCTHCLVRIHAIGEQNVNNIVPPLFTFCSSTLEQTKNKPWTGTKREQRWPPMGVRVTICSIRSFRGGYSNISNVHHWHTK